MATILKRLKQLDPLTNAIEILHQRTCLQNFVLIFCGKRILLAHRIIFVQALDTFLHFKEHTLWVKTGYENHSQLGILLHSIPTSFGPPIFFNVLCY